MSELKEYIVTLHRHEDLAGFCEDMETPGGDLYIPGREVSKLLRVKYSKNILYRLTKDEASLLKNDVRVLNVVDCSSITENIEGFGLIQSDNWDKSYNLGVDDKNWALLRCTEGENRNNWGVTGDLSLGIGSLDNTNANVSGIAYLTSTGKNVDVVIVDIGHADPSSPEFLNAEGTASRYNQIDWYQYFGDSTIAPYEYPTATNPGSGAGTGFNTASSEEHNHAYHVATIACGRSQGWAKDANIYSFDVNSRILDTDGNYIDGGVGGVFYVFDLIRAWHLSKPINPETGIRNPTIVNNSWGAIRKYRIKDTSVKFAVEVRGVRTPSTGVKSWETTEDESTLASLGLRWIAPSSGVDLGLSEDQILLKYPTAPDYLLNAFLSPQIQDAIDNGIIFVAATGNHYCKICKDSSDPDWNNKVIFEDGSEEYYHRGTLSAISNVISVSNVSNFADEKISLRNGVGPRVDVFAPGVTIISSVHNNIEHTDINGWGGWEQETYYPTIDINGRTYSKWSYDGSGATSMSCPQVTGVLACILEHYPRMNQQDCKDFITTTAKVNQIGGDTTDLSGTDWTSDESLYGAPNRYLYYKKQRETQGYVTAQLTNNVRKSSGMMFPRRRHI
jgi:hypothetical protein